MMHRVLNPLVLILVFISLLPACKKGNSSGSTPEESLKGERITMSDDYLGGGTPIFVRNGEIISNSSDPQYLYVYSVIRNDSVISLCNILKRGGGPDEVFMSNSEMSITDKGRILAISEKGGSMFSIDEFVKNGDHFDIVNISDKDDKMKDICKLFRSFILENDSTILATMAPYENPDNFFARYDFRNNEFHPIKWMPDEENKRDPYAKFRAYADNSFLFTNSKGKYLYVSGNERNAFIFTLTGDKLNVESKIYDTPLEYQLAPDGMNYACRLTGYEIRADVDNGLIYLLLVEKDKTGKHNDSPLKNRYGDRIEVYDWNGNLKRILILDHLGLCIKVDSSNSSLYLFSLDNETGEYVMWKYKL